ncbi:unnamed protein product [Nezara viridula]|uniref:Cytochrome P450 n=1 Tax=Nezara viridula TaxID=85310 RepID=A0A9P0H5A3_NEZVI|nr:unnamed protein product [Nezara viridula]
MGLVTNDWKTDLLIATSSVCILIYCMIRNIYSFFEKRNIKYVKPKFLLGSEPDGVLFKIHITESWERIYKKLEHEKYGGFFHAILPTLMIRDPEYIEDILKTSFDHFVDRSFLVDVKTNPLDENLFFMRGNKWKYLRCKMASLFSQIKLKWMYEEIEKCSNTFDECLSEFADGKDADIKDLLARFVTDVVASCGFGVEPQALKNPDWIFRDIGREIVDPESINMPIFLLRFSIPRLLIWFKIKTLTKKLRNFFLSTTKRILHHRRSTGIIRKDFVQLFLELKEKGTVGIDSRNIDTNKTNTESNNEIIELTDNLLAANSFLFFLAGFETTSTTLYYTYYFLAKHQEIQERARKEVQEVKAKYGHFTFDSLKELKFLINCISETMRIYPPIAVVIRECTKDYNLLDGTLIDKGMRIIVPIMSIHRDPKNFAEPMEYKPERFENPPASGTYLPFGDGPRICIGKRFAEIIMYSTLARTLDKYKLELSPKCDHEIKLNPKVISTTPVHGLFFRIHKLNDTN